MMTVVVAVGAGVGETEAEADADGFGDVVALGDAPGLQDAGAASGDALGDGTTAAVEPEALKVVPKMPANKSAAASEEMNCRIRF